MKKTICTILGVLLLGSAAFAQERGSGAANSQLAIDSGTSIDAELQSTLDVKKAKAGDQVVLKTTKAIKRNGATVIPKGTSLIGRVTEVRQQTKENASSKIGIIFERVQGKDLSAPINASIVSITSAQTAASIGDTMDTNIAGSSSSSGRVGTNASGSTAAGGLLGGTTNIVGGVTGVAGQTVGGVTNTAGQTVGGVANTASRAVGGTAGAVRQTISGINISQSASGSVQNSTTLSSPNKNIKLDKGVMFQLRFNSN
jgi:hypothetical protein